MSSVKVDVAHLRILTAQWPLEIIFYAKTAFSMVLSKLWSLLEKLPICTPLEYEYESGKVLLRRLLENEYKLEHGVRFGV